MNELALFAGAGCGLLGSLINGWHTVCAVENDVYCQDVLLARQRDGILPRFPIWDDIRTFDGLPWRQKIDIVTGGFPCQDISAAGKRAGLEGRRSGLWFEMQRVVREVWPTFVWVENSPNLRTKGLDKILKGFTEMGYNARWCVLGARHVGANHIRDRMWILAYSDEYWKRVLPFNEKVAFPLENDGNSSNHSLPLSKTQVSKRRNSNSFQFGVHPWWSEDRYSGVDDGSAYRMDRVRATGNGQVPGVVDMAWQILSQGLIK